MKSRKVLLGLIAGFFVCFAGIATAQNANYKSTKLVEIGPDNIGGRITSVVVMNHLDGEVAQLYAGAASGGLYTRTSEITDVWSYQPCYVDGRELTLPISCMAKINDSTILIGTGECIYQPGNRQNKFSAIGRGLFCFNTNTKAFTPIDLGIDEFECIRTISVMNIHDTALVFVATGSTLYRLSIVSDEDWYDHEVVFNGPVRSIVLSQQTNRAYFSSNGHLYKVSDVINGSQPIDITSSCTGFIGCKDIELALAPSDETYLYAMACGQDGAMSGLYLTRNTNTWLLLSTSTVTPFLSSTSDVCGSMAVDPNDPARIIIAGDVVWVGKGYVENAPYQWARASMSESQLNSGNYMAYVFSNPSFVHSGIQKVVADKVYDGYEGAYSSNYYFATEGGVFMSEQGVGRFYNINRGMNSVQINSVAVCPDGSLITGANANACPFIESRMEHHGGINDSTWYDGSRTNTNHLANILWKGNGGAVAASRFSQYQIESRRNIFVSSQNGQIGRAYKDFLDFTNTQTWTADSSFLSEMIVGGPAVGQMYLWETDHNTLSNDSVSCLIDTLAYAYRNGEKFRLSENFNYQPGDSVTLFDIGHAYYPFGYTFTTSGRIGDHHSYYRNADTLLVPAPYLSRLAAVVVEKDQTHTNAVALNWLPTDFRHLFNGSRNSRYWGFVHTGNSKTHCNLVAISNDGDCVFIAMENDSTKENYIVRVHGLNNVNYNAEPYQIASAMRYNNNLRVTHTDTLCLWQDSVYMIPRHIASFAVDPRDGEDNIIVTFDGYDTAFTNVPNVVYIANATSDNPTVTNIPIDATRPVFSAMVEATTGSIYAGTEDGVWIKSAQSGSAWERYGAFDGVPVTAICQQLSDNQLQRHVLHDGVEEKLYIFPRTKWSKAIYFGTYGRGVFMDTTFVVNHQNEIVDPRDYSSIPAVASNGANSVRFYPNPAVDNATMELSVVNSGKAQLKIYDLSGKLVYSEDLGRLAEGVHTRTVSCQNLSHGMYLVNVLVGSERATSKLLVR